ncbi:hypothetical protein JCM16418_3609 [Paenibacillus pini JCM 16418]|uniref:Uncharacterized protein n=1 Tax=Paenibacillus pini JCM 16418 TaxID=1236976 RepID=W7YPC3_9BACL|nr:hypothetical protein JCM16418_3609 [Paenibacillus pini JCM 16418]
MEPQGQKRGRAFVVLEVIILTLTMRSLKEPAAAINDGLAGVKYTAQQAPTT